MKKLFNRPRKRAPSLKALRERAKYYSRNMPRWDKEREIIPRMTRSARANIFAAYKAEGLGAARKVYEAYRGQEAFDEVNEMLRETAHQVSEEFRAVTSERLPKKLLDKYPLSQEEIKSVRDNLDSFFRALEKKDKGKKN